MTYAIRSHGKYLLKESGIVWGHRRTWEDNLRDASVFDYTEAKEELERLNRHCPCAVRVDVVVMDHDSYWEVMRELGELRAFKGASE